MIFFVGLILAQASKTFQRIFPGGLWLAAGILVLLLTFYRWLNKRE